jgi:regulator of RNase E activity RraB
MIESYEMLLLFHAGVGVGQISEREFAQVIFRVKSALPTSTTEEIFGDLLQEVVSRESVWADGWQKYYENSEAKRKYEETSEDFQEHMLKYAQTNANC